MFAGGGTAIPRTPATAPYPVPVPDTQADAIAGSNSITTQPAKAHHHSHPSYTPLSDISTASEIIVVNHGTSNVPRTV